MLSNKIDRVYSEYTETGVGVTKWQDSRNLVSLEFHDEMVQMVSKRNIAREKTDVVLKYIKFKAGTNRSDQLLSYSLCEHKTLRSFVKLGINMFQIMSQTQIA